jgi:hypothetical protein
LNISVKGEYALLALFDLTSRKPGEPVRIADIARRQKIPQKFLELILAGLKQGSFVESRRGAEGGYLLARRRWNHGRRRSPALHRRPTEARRATGNPQFALRRHVGQVARRFRHRRALFSDLQRIRGEARQVV